MNDNDISTERVEDLDRLVSVLATAIEGYELQRRERAAPTIDVLELLRAHAHSAADGVDRVLEDWFGDDD